MAEDCEITGAEELLSHESRGETNLTAQLVFLWQLKVIKATADNRSIKPVKAVDHLFSKNEFGRSKMN